LTLPIGKPPSTAPRLPQASKDTDADAAVQKRSSSARRWNRRLVSRRLPPGGILLGPAVLVAVWQTASMADWLSPKILAAPSTAALTGFDMLKSGALAGHLLASAERAYLGLGIGVAAALVFALVAGLSTLGEAMVDGLVQIKRAIPTLALIPLGILWLGIGDAMKVALIATSVFIPVYINTHAGLRSIDLRYVELAQSLGLGHLEFLRRVVLPGALPGFLTGLRLAVTACWTALVVMEQINATNGIGYLMNRARDYGQTDIMVVGLAVYAMLGLASDLAVRLAERRLLSYRRALGS
jgi:sulfonate transport system permease protein